jgi:hypothetical protein
MPAMQLKTSDQIYFTPPRSTKGNKRTVTTKHSMFDALVSPNATKGAIPKYPIMRNGFKSASPTGKSSPNKLETNGAAYAGAKFSHPPAPNALPRPPTHWTATGDFPNEYFKENSGTIISLGNNTCSDLSDHLKLLLKVQA